MSDELVNKLRAVDHLSLEDCFCQSSLYDKAADRIEGLEENQRFIIRERDRTFALMLARAEKAEAERDRLRKELEAIANDYEAGYPLSHDTIKYAARAALKGESHE